MSYHVTLGHLGAALCDGGQKTVDRSHQLSPTDLKQTSNNGYFKAHRYF